MISQGPSFGGGFDFMFTLIPIIIIIVFVIVIIGAISRGARHVKNATSPQTSLYAKVIAKRMEVRNHSNHHNHNDMMHSHNSSRTYYYITLEFDNGERKEYLDVKNLFGLVVEGDTGYAAVQGEWIVAFQRELESR
ncbi:DUF2500 domain-containing protein [Paenibacillus sp. GCM10028914]|uniref:DUF2500 domain-containing protein n=1 Tax=Paenibacillus sp. GCM10028914 TaxID=3273416 RepID=UPI00360DB6CC